MQISGAKEVLQWVGHLPAHSQLQGGPPSPPSPKTPPICNPHIFYLFLKSQITTPWLKWILVRFFGCGWESEDHLGKSPGLLNGGAVYCGNWVGSSLKEAMSCSRKRQRIISALDGNANSPWHSQESKRLLEARECRIQLPGQNVSPGSQVLGCFCTHSWLSSTVTAALWWHVEMLTLC